jgi:hypothetical protein
MQNTDQSRLSVCDSTDTIRTWQFCPSGTDRCTKHNQFLRHRAAHIHTHIKKKTELTLALPENPNLCPFRTAVSTKQKRFLDHKHTHSGITPRWYQHCLTHLCTTRTEVSMQHKQFLQHRRLLTQQEYSTNTSTISHLNPLFVCNGDYYTTETLPLPRAPTHNSQPWITAITP